MTEGGVVRPWAKPSDIGDVWRPLTTAEEARATKLIGQVERGIIREWPTVPARLDAGTLAVEDVSDVVIWAVLGVIGHDADIPINAKAYQESSGSESRSITLDGPIGDSFLEFAPWMVRVFEPVGSPRALGPVSRSSAPAGGRFDGLGFLWPENGAQRFRGAERER